MIPEIELYQIISRFIAAAVYDAPAHSARVSWVLQVGLGPAVYLSSCPYYAVESNTMHITGI